MEDFVDTGHMFRCQVGSVALGGAWKRSTVCDERVDLQMLRWDRSQRGSAAREYGRRGFVAGTITLRQLVDRLRGRVRLADYPDYVANWTALDASSRDSARPAPDAIAGRVRLSARHGPRDRKEGDRGIGVGRSPRHFRIGQIGYCEKPLDSSAVVRDMCDRTMGKNTHA
jgi:hypothetical protein